MTTANAGVKSIPWYRTPLNRETLTQLNTRNDFKGFLQAGSHLGLLIATGTTACLMAGKWPWWALLALLFLHGTIHAFIINGFHELIHGTVFNSKILNKVFLSLFSFFGMYNPVAFKASHNEHHKFTLHPPADLEVVLPIKLTLIGFLKIAFINPQGLKYVFANHIRLSTGLLEGAWEQSLFPDSAPALRRDLILWSRIILYGHILIAAVSMALGFWMVTVVITLAPFYGQGIQWLCNNTQHTGLTNNVPDFRLCCRTIYLNPVLEYLYWNMNYHTEHHMYAAVPCYNLRRLNKLIRHDLPYCPNGLIDTWRQISRILNTQKLEPTYQYRAELPPFQPSIQTAETS
jgi:fatty acid desaturase